MAVTSNKIAVTAMRATVLLGEFDQAGRHPHRDGSGDIVEVYPAAALKKWGPVHKGYKGKKGALKRRELVGNLFGPDGRARWLKLNEHLETCRASDNALDAVLCALIAGARFAGAWITPDCEWVGSDGGAGHSLTDHDREAVAKEGWIILPTVELEELHSAVAAHARSSASHSG